MDERLINWIVENGSALLNLILALVAIIVAIVQNWTSVKSQAYEGMLQAKRLAKDNILTSGQAQEDWVVSMFYPKLPAQVKLFISETTFRTIVKKLYTIAKDAVDGKIGEAPAEGGGE